MGGKLVDQLIAHPFVHLGEDIGVELLGERDRERLARVGGHEFEEVGDIGWVERRNHRAHGLDLARLDMGDHRLDEIGGQPVLIVMAGHCGSSRGGSGGIDIILAHARLPHA